MRYLFLILLLITQPAFAKGPLKWGELPSLPDNFGFGGPIVGVHDEALIVCGGANFPDGPPWADGDQPAGSKVWHDRIFVLTPGANEWIEAGKLPHSLAYAPAISTKHGVYVLGGETFDQTNHATAGVLLLKWDPKTEKVIVIKDALPPLPKPCQYHNAAIIDDAIFVTASHTKNESSRKLDVKSFWSLDLSKPEPERKWVELEPWPGPPREKMAVAVQNAGANQSNSTPSSLYMFSGANWFKNADGSYDLAKFEHYTDAYRYNPLTMKWKRIADLPVVPESRDIKLKGYQFDSGQRIWRRLTKGEQQPKLDVNKIFQGDPQPAAAATAIDVGQSRILLFSGATGRYITLDIQERPLFPRDVLTYHTITDTWTRAGQMPIGVVTTGIAKWNDQIVIPSGEVRPGVRTNRVQTLKGAF